MNVEVNAKAPSSATDASIAIEDVEFLEALESIQSLEALSPLEVSETNAGMESLTKHFLSLVPPPQAPQDAPLMLWYTTSLSNRLHASLELDEILNQYYLTVGTAIRMLGMRYENGQVEYDFTRGLRTTSFTYFDLYHDEQDLGRLTFYHVDKMLSDSIVLLLNQIAMAILQPIRNAVIYLQAIRAAHIDDLTGVGSRLNLEKTLQRELESALRYEQPLSLIMLDIDHFKDINDNYGHTLGDEILKALGELLSETNRGSDMAFRYGGEEFILILPKTTLPGARITAERLRRAIERNIQLQCELDEPVTVSFGIANYFYGETKENLLARLDSALYQAKKEGRNRVAIAESAEVNRVNVRMPVM